MAAGIPPDDMSAAHLANTNGGFEPQRAFNWILILPTDQNNIIQLSIESFQIPRYGTQVIPMRYLNQVRKVAGGATVQETQLTVRDFVDVDTYGYINKWMERVHFPPSGKIGYAKHYKANCSLQLLDPMGQARGSIKCLGVWPSSFNAPELSYTSDTTEFKVNLTLQVDLMDFRDFRPVTAPSLAPNGLPSITPGQ